MRRWWRPALGALVLFAAPAAAQEPAAPAPERPAADATAPDGAGAPEPRFTFGGSADFYFASNFNDPFHGRNDLHLFDFRDERGIHLGLIDLWGEAARRPVGGRLDLAWGPTARISNEEEPTDDDLWEHVQQAYLSVNLNRKGSTYVDLGKWITPAGAEVVEPLDNVMYSQGLLFSWATPYYHLGARLFHYFNDEDYVMLHLNRGWNAVGSPGHGPGFGVTYARQICPEWGVTASYLGGEEGDDFGRNTWRHLVDLVALYNPGGRWSYTFNADYAIQRDVRFDEERKGPARWYGLMALAKYALSEREYLAARGEWFRDDSGFLMGDDLDTYSVTLNYTRAFGRRFQTRLEYRHDFAGGGQPFAGRRADRFGADQGMVILGAIVSY